MFCHKLTIYCIDLLSFLGYSWRELCGCIEWLNPYAQIIKEQKLNQIKQFDKVREGCLPILADFKL